MDNGRMPSNMGAMGSADAEPDDAQDAAGAQAFMVTILPDGMATIEPVGQQQMPPGGGGSASPIPIGEALQMLVDAAKQAGGASEREAFAQGFSGGAERTLRDTPRGLRPGAMR